jgi:hypothetical protein
MTEGKGNGAMLWAIAAIILLLWLGGFAFHVAGSLIHLLLVVAVLMVLYNLFVRASAGRRAAL